MDKIKYSEIGNYKMDFSKVTTLVGVCPAGNINTELTGAIIQNMIYQVINYRFCDVIPSNDVVETDFLLSWNTLVDLGVFVKK